jgi:hypothetical protein
MRTGVLVYISGPLSPKDGYLIEENVAAGLRLYLELLRLGIPAFCPQLCGAFPSAWNIVDYEIWLEYDLRVIDRCTHVLMMPRWGASHGARREREYALHVGKPVFETVGALQASF